MSASLKTDLVITSYGTLYCACRGSPKRLWRLAVIDEAQAIKNPGAKQTRAVKGLKSDARIALTGTPIENSLGDLWSIFDFVNPGLLGSAKQFSAFAKSLANQTHKSVRPASQARRSLYPAALKNRQEVSLPTCPIKPK